jgi:hypothetical protein
LIPKSSFLNQANVTLCQHYPSALNDLTLPEEYLVAKAHPVGEFQSSDPVADHLPVNYHHTLRGHFIVIPQDPGPLLQILPSPELHFAQLIKVVWLGNQQPATSNLEHFLMVRTHKVLAALQYLVEHNPLYQDITIE